MASQSNQFWLDDNLSEEQKNELRKSAAKDRNTRVNKRNNETCEDSDAEVVFNLKKAPAPALPSGALRSDSQDEADATEAYATALPESSDEEEKRTLEPGQEYFLPDPQARAPIEKIQLHSNYERQRINRDMEELTDSNIFGEDTGSMHDRYDGYIPSSTTLRKSIDEIDKFHQLNPRVVFSQIPKEQNNKEKDSNKNTSDKRPSDNVSDSQKEHVDNRNTVDQDKVIQKDASSKVSYLRKNRGLSKDLRKRIIFGKESEERQNEVSSILAQKSELNQYKAMLADERRKNEKLRLQHKQEVRKQRLTLRKNATKLAEAKRLLKERKSASSGFSSSDAKAQDETCLSDSVSWTDIDSPRRKVVTSDNESVIGMVRRTMSDTDNVNSSRRKSSTSTKSDRIKKIRQAANPNRNNSANSSNPTKDVKPPIVGLGGAGGGGGDSPSDSSSSSDTSGDEKKGGGGDAWLKSSFPKGLQKYHSLRKTKKKKGKKKGIPETVFPHQFSHGTRAQYEAFKKQFYTLARYYQWDNNMACIELYTALQSPAIERLDSLTDEQACNINEMWKALDDAYLPANHRRVVLAEFYACKRKPKENMKTYYLNLRDKYINANKAADDFTVREAVRETMLNNLDEEDYEICRPYLHENDPEVIANNYDSIVLQLKRNNKGVKKQSDMVFETMLNKFKESVIEESSQKGKESIHEASTQIPLEVDNVTVNVVQPAGDQKGRTSHTHLCTRTVNPPINHPPPIVVYPKPPITVPGGPEDGQVPFPGTIPNQNMQPQYVPPQPAYAPLNAYVAQPIPQVMADPMSPQYQQPPIQNNVRNNDSQDYKKNDGNQMQNQNSDNNGRQDYNDNQNGGGYRGRGRGGYRGGYRGRGRGRGRGYSPSYGNNGNYGNHVGNRDDSNMICYGCGRKGHRVRNCDQQKNGQINSNVQQQTVNQYEDKIKQLEQTQSDMRRNIDLLYQTNLKASGLTPSVGTGS